MSDLLPPLGPSTDFKVSEGLSSAERIKLHKAAIDFEAILIQQLLKQTHSQDARGMFGGGMAEEFFQDHLTQERAKVMAQNGGLGVAKMIEDELLGETNLKKPEAKADETLNLSQQIQAKMGLKTYGDHQRSSKTD